MLTSKQTALKAQLRTTSDELEVIRKLRANPKLRKKVKVFAVPGVIGFFVTGALVIWAGVTAISVAQVENLKEGVKGLKLQPLSCWGKAQSLMAVEPWLARPALDNLKNLKTACFEAASPVCEGPAESEAVQFCPRIGSKVSLSELCSNEMAKLSIGFS